MYTMTKWFMVFLTMNMLIACSSSDENAPVPASQGQLEGTVKDSTTNAILAFATVQVGDRLDVTGEAGIYSFDELDSGQRSITVTRLGYKTFSDVASITAGSTANFEILMSPGDPGDTTAPSIPTGAIIVNESNGSLDNIRLSWQAATDDNKVSGYMVYRDGARLASTAQLSFVDAKIPVCYAITAFDEAGNESIPSDTVCTDTSLKNPPQASITSPLNGANLALTTVNLSGIGTDTEDGTLGGSSLIWRSSQDGELGQGESLQIALSPGSHEISLTATDSDGQSHSHRIQITVNAPPQVTITSPSDGSNFTFGANIDFMGIASDLEDGMLSDSQLLWRSNLDGTLGNGLSLSLNSLSLGSHTITFMATDSQSAIGETNIKLEVSAAPVAILAVTPEALNLGETTISAELSVSNLGTLALNWSATDNANWLNLSPTSGNVGNQSQAVTVNVNREGMVRGNYATNVDFNSNGGQKTVVVNIVVANHAPEILSTCPSANHEVNTLYSYTPSTMDLDNDTLSFSLNNAPAGMSIDATSGLVNWTPTLTTNVSFDIFVNDNNTGISKQTCQLSVVDSVAPNNNTLTDFINNGDTVTSTSNVLVTLLATDNLAVTHYFIEHSALATSNPPASNASGWQAVSIATANYQDTVSHDFSAGGFANGSTVYLHTWLKDGAGNISNLVSDNIVFDNSDALAPNNCTNNNFVNNGDTKMRSSSINLSLCANDNIGVTAYFVAENTSGIAPSAPIADGIGWMTINPAISNYQATVNYALNGQYAKDDNIHIYVWFKDAAGNVSSEVTDNIIFDPAVFSEDFENGIGFWSVSNGVWQIGATTPPPDAHSGTSVAGTVLAGNYPDFTQSRLISPPIQLPNLGIDEELNLRFWHWFSLNNRDRGQVQISEETSPGVWSPFATISTHWYSSARWTQRLLDLTVYAGKRIRIGYFLQQHQSLGGVGRGWYIDDVSIVVETITEKITANSPYQENFEAGLGNWSASNGIWQVGAINSGPSACNNGSQCGATILDGSYPDWTDSLLVSPPMSLPNLAANESIILRFWHWFSLNNRDRGHVQISEETSPGVWSAFTTISTHWYSSARWTQRLLDLSAYSGKRIRIGFKLTQHTSLGGVGAGWYVDDISLGIESDITRSPSLNSPYVEDFENGLGDWSASNGIWQVGTISAGPAACGAGLQCAATILDGNYPDWTDSLLLSPPIQLPAASGNESFLLRFRHWFSLNNRDRAYVQISEETSPGIWSPFTSISTHWYSSARWTTRTVDLRVYAGKKIRLGFSLTQHTSLGGVGAGWFMDQFSVSIEPDITIPISVGVNFIDTFESGLGNWSASNGIWDVGAINSGPSVCEANSTLCAATVLDGNYPDWTDSMLISPPMQLPITDPGVETYLRFKHWFSFNNRDLGRIRISEETAPGVWSTWTNLPDTFTLTTSPWSASPLVSLTAYSGKKIRFAFALVQHTSLGGVGAGWYLDDVEITFFIP